MAFDGDGERPRRDHSNDRRPIRGPRCSTTRVLRRPRDSWTDIGGTGVARLEDATTDAPYRETSEQLERHASNGILAVETQAASLFAFGAARGVRCGVVAHVTNGSGHLPEAQFDKGAHQLGFEILKAMSRAGRRYLSSF